MPSKSTGESSQESDFQRAVAFVAASRYRRAVLETLADADGTPSSIAAEHDDMDIAHVSRALSELREHECVELTVPEDVRKGRIYAATERGVDVWERVAEVGGDE